MKESLLQRVLKLLDTIESPVILHADAAAYPADELASLRARAILSSPSGAHRIPRPKRYGPGPDVDVNDGPMGLVGVVEDDDFHYDPILLTVEDTLQYPISLRFLVDAIRSENDILGAGFENEKGLISLGTKTLEQEMPASVYLSLPNMDEQAVLARCSRLRVPNTQQRSFLLLPGIISFSSEARRIMSDSKLDVLSLMEPAARCTLGLDWATTHASIVASENASVFRKKGEVWELSFDGKTVHLTNRTGMGYIAELLRRPHAAIEAASLAGAPINEVQLVAGGIPLADPDAIRQVKATLKEKESELARVPANDWTRRGPLQEEIDKVKKYLAGVQDHRGQPRKVGGSAQRSRTAVTTAVNRARDYISEHHHALGHHLKESIQTGTSLVYAPSRILDWQL